MHLGHDSKGNKEKIPETQGEHSEYLVRQFIAHQTRTVDWLASKNITEQEVGHASVVIKPSMDYRGSNEEHKWNMNGLPFDENQNGGKYSDSTAPYIVLSTAVMRRNGDVDGAYCLDGGQPKAGSKLRVSACYPSEDPDMNRDPMQHFVMHADGTLRLFNPSGADHLCVTNHLFDEYKRRGLSMRKEDMLRALKGGGDSDSKFYSHEQQTVTLEECVDGVWQTFAYHGPAPGDGGGGNLEFGDVEFYLGVVCVHVCER